MTDDSDTAGSVATVLVAPDKFKGSLSAVAVADAVCAGIHRGTPQARVGVCPVADGGEGTVAAALAAGHTEVPVRASGPTGEPVWTRYARDRDVAVVELADVSGMGRLPGGVPAAMTASSRGTGEVIAAAVDAGCRRVVLGVGGSACTDGGAGMAQALGARLRDVRGREIGSGGDSLAALATVDLEPLARRLAGVEVVLACDVDNPLTGPHGAAAVYGPQKGAGPEQVRVLDRGLNHLADVLAAATGVDHRATPGSGTAGGVGLAAATMLGARLLPGADLVLDLVGFNARVAGTDLVVTGEGSLDAQTLRGKAPAGVAAACLRAGVPVLAVCGSSTLDTGDLRAAGFRAVYPLTELEPDPRRCRSDAPALLERVGARIAAEHLAC